MNQSWSALARTLGRHRGALIGGIASAVAVALTLDPGAGLARSSMRFSLWFAFAATALAVVLTAFMMIADLRAARPQLPRAIARRSRG